MHPYVSISQQSLRLLTFFVFLAIVDNGVGGGPGGDVAGDGGHHGVVHLSRVIAANQEHHVLTNQVVYNASKRVYFLSKIAKSCSVYLSS